MFRNIKAFAIFLFLLPNLAAHAQVFKNISVNEGLSNNTVYSIQQYNKGLMWISTKTGIDKFDGSNFKHYSLYEKDEVLQYGHRVTKLHVDQYNRLWVHNNFDIFLYNKELDKFILIHTSLNTNIFHDLIAIDLNNLLLATRNGLANYNLKTGKEKEHTGLSNTNKLVKYDDNLVLVGQNDKIHAFNFKTGSLQNDIIQPAILKEFQNNAITAIGVDNQRNIFIGASRKVFTFRLNSSKLSTSEQLNQQFENCDIRKFLVDKENNVYIGTDGAGIYKVNTQLQILKSYISDQDDPSTLVDNSISDILIDKNDRMWVGGRGLSYSDPNKHKFQFIHHQINKENSLIHNFVRAIAEDAEGNLLLGTKYGISVFDRNKNRWRHITQASTNNALSTNKILSFANDPQKNIIVGAYQQGLFKIDRDSKISPYFNERKSVYSILQDEDTLWISEFPSEIRKINTVNGKSKKFLIPYVLSITKNAKGDVITGGHTGITFVNRQGNMVNYGAIEQGIGSIFNVKVDSRDILWGASEGQGLLKFNDQTQKFKKYTTEDGLPSNIIYGILEDKTGKLWLSTDKGLSRFDPEKEEFNNYSTADGLPIKEFNYGASAITSSGEMVFGGINGFVIFKPEEIVDKNIKHQLLFTDFKLFNHSVEANDENSPLKKVVDETSHIDLKYNQDAVAIEFTAVNYTNPSKTVYRWKLDGLDKEWSPVTTENTATYTNLKPGKYTFQVESSYNPLHFTGEGRTLHITVHPPFWKTYWAYFIYIILILAFLYFVSRFYYIKISELHAKDKIRFFINIAHDIRTPLSLIKSPLSLAIKKNDFSTETLQSLKTAEKNADRLSHLINQLLDFEKVRSNKSNIKLVPILAEKTIQELTNNFMPLIEQKKITLQSDYKQLNTKLYVDRDKFEKIIFNLFSNAIKYTPDHGIINISTTRIRNNYIIKISDTGLGIPKEQQKHIFQNYFRAQNAVNSNEVGSGIGLMLTKKLIELHKGTIAFESDTNKGSVFTVNLPIQRPAKIEYAEWKVESSFDETSAEKKQSNDKKPKLLIAEDHKELRSHLEQNLSEIYQISIAENGKEALKMVNTVSPDIILSDVMMPEMNGNQLCFEIKNNIRTSHIPVILLSSLTENQYKIEAIQTGADIYLEKPFDLELLKSALANLLENRKRLRDKFLQNDVDAADGISKLDKKLIDQAFRILEDNLSNSKFSVEVFEKEIGLSHATLYRKFKTLLGKTPLEFMNQYRLKKALEFLRSGEYNINEVAYMVGFSDPKYFSTVFKKHFGSNASEYLKKNSVVK